MCISCVAKARLFTAVFLQLSIFTADCLRHPIQMAGVETIWELHTLSVIYSCFRVFFGLCSVSHTEQFLAALTLPCITLNSN